MGDFDHVRRFNHREAKQYAVDHDGISERFIHASDYDALMAHYLCTVDVLEQTRHSQSDAGGDAPK